MHGIGLLEMIVTQSTLPNEKWKGAKFLHSKVGSRETITLIACGNAEGTLSPPHFIFKGKTKMALRSWDTENAPSDTMMSVSETGWTKQGLAQLWFENVFLKNIGPQRPQALIFDGHDSHHHVELINSAIRNNIILIELPSHTSNWLQPLDRTFFGPMKMKWRKQLSELMAETACTASHINFFLLFSKVWDSMVMEPEKLRNGFAATGIYPLNPNAIPDEAYEPSKLYLRKIAEDTESSEPSGTDKSEVAPAETPVEDVNIASVTTDNIVKATILEEKPYGSDASNTFLGLPEGFSLVDLNCTLNEDGVLVQNAPCSSSINETCPPDLALAAVECSLTTQKMSEYLSAFNRNCDIPGDRVYQTWKLYKSQMPDVETDDVLLEALANDGDHVDNDIFPTVVLPPKKRKTEEKKSFFVLTSHEAYKDKLEALERKEQKKTKKLKTSASKQC